MIPNVSAFFSVFYMLLDLPTAYFEPFLRQQPHTLSMLITVFSLITIILCNATLDKLIISHHISGDGYDGYIDKVQIKEAVVRRCSSK